MDAYFNLVGSGGTLSLDASFSFGARQQINLSEFAQNVVIMSIMLSGWVRSRMEIADVNLIIGSRECRDLAGGARRFQCQIV